MDNKEWQYFFEIHSDLPREGPGNFESTERAYNSIRKFLNNPLILDAGCGPGAQTIDLLKISDAKIIAVDNHLPFLYQLNNKIIERNFVNRIGVLAGDMLKLPFNKQSLDVVWSEGAIYNIGFENGLIAFNKYLKPEGFLVASEASWTTYNISADVRDFWIHEYPAIKHFEDNFNICAKSGYRIIDHFILDKSAWFDNYYNPMLPKIEMMKKKHKGNLIAENVIKMHEKEIEIMDRYSSECGYVFYILQKTN